MNAPDKAVAFEALMKDTPGFDHYDSGYDGILPECRTCRFHRPLWKYQSCVFEECPCAKTASARSTAVSTPRLSGITTSTISLP